MFSSRNVVVNDLSTFIVDAHFFKFVLDFPMMQFSRDISQDAEADPVSESRALCVHSMSEDIEKGFAEQLHVGE